MMIKGGYRASFYADVSYSELMYYREEKRMSNGEIAKLLGVSHKMIIDRIGPQPRELDRRISANRKERKTK